MRGIEIGLNGIYIDTLEMYGLALMSDVQISAPEQRTSYVEVPGMNGYLDLTDTVRGWPVFNDREITFRLHKNMTDTQRATMINTLANVYGNGGCEFRFPFESSGYVWGGRLTFGGVACEDKGIIPVTAIVEPFRNETTEYIVSATMTASYQSLTINNTGAKPICPVITASRSCSIEYTSTLHTTKTATYTLSALTQFRIPDLWIKGGYTGTVKVKYTDSTQTGSANIAFTSVRGVFY